MIIIAGVEYMTVESIFGKQVARGRITNALTGLLVGLGIFLILSTINPRLLEVNFVAPEASIEFIGDGGVEPTKPPELTIQGNNLCERFETVQQPDALNVKQIVVCSTIKSNVENLLASAKQDGIILSGYGARSIKRQEELREQNCGGKDAVYDRKAKCNPPTAFPGNSMHNYGLAIDFLCVIDDQEGFVNVHEGNTHGTKREWTRPCFNWLRANANRFGLKELTTENWHWSTNGR
jgi:hypothetical protein